jgi:hypothetical protein
MTFAFHDSTTLSPTAPRKVLIDEVELSEDEARKLL